MNLEDNTELSTLMALARLLKGKTVDEGRRHQVLDKLHSDWAKNMAAAIMSDDTDPLNDEERKDLKIVRQLAGIEQ
jgi:hypothetical protein